MHKKTWEKKITVKFKEYDVKDIAKYMIWLTDAFTKYENVDALRRGMCYVEDITGFSMSQSDPGPAKHFLDTFQVKNRKLTFVDLFSTKLNRKCFRKISPTCTWLTQAFSSE